MFRLALALSAFFLTARILAAEARPKDGVSPIVEGNKAFALDLFAKLRKERAENLFVSPYSISSALAMTLAGARGDTEAQFVKVLHQSLPQAELHQAWEALRKNLLSVSGTGKSYRLNIADRLWGQRGYHILPEFLTLTRVHYDADMALLDFARQPEEARRTINAWVADQTEDKIRNLLASPLDTDTRLVLTDAIYFRADWAEPFPKHATRDTPFHVDERKEVVVPMMRRMGKYAIAVEEGFKALEIPYEAGEMSMVVLLPDQVGGLPALEAKLTPANLDRWLGKLEQKSVVVSFPRFKLTSEVDLVPSLQALGLTDVFQPGRGDLSGIGGKRDLYVSAAVHQAFVDVHEEGTEAAAATAIAVGVRSAAIHAPINFLADHPFLFLIRDNRTGSLLFLGCVNNPKS